MEELIVFSMEKMIQSFHLKCVTSNSRYDREEKLYLNEIFDLIPSELNAKNKRFLFKNLNEGAKYSKFRTGKDYYRHNAMDNVLNCAEYNIPAGHVYCNGNVEVRDNVVYYPVYMLMFMRKEETPETLIYNVDFSVLNDKV